DDDGVRCLTRHLLEKLGYEVLEADGADAACRLAAKHAGRIDLLITDVVMPGMNGCQVAEQLARLHPEARALFVSGYTDDAVIRHGILQEDVEFLAKPFSAAALARK